MTLNSANLQVQAVPEPGSFFLLVPRERWGLGKTFSRQEAGLAVPVMRASSRGASWLVILFLKRDYRLAFQMLAEKLERPFPSELR